MKAKVVVSGEYNRVALWSHHRDLLDQAHGTPCTPAEAKALIGAMGRHFKCDVEVSFRAGHAGRSWPGRQRLRLPVDSLPVDWQTYTERPGCKRMVTEGGQPSRIGWLRVGIVLHEYAHCLLRRKMSGVPLSEIKRQERGPHGRLFVRTLDEVLEWWAGRSKICPTKHIR